MKVFLIISLALVAGALNAQFGELSTGKFKKELKTANKGGLKLSEDEVVDGLKEALANGADQAVAALSVADGFYKDPILVIKTPQDGEKAKSYALKMGMDQQVNDFEMSMNRAAEDATAKAIQILTNAIKDMSVSDAFDILKGEDDAATNYLKSSCTGSLEKAFQPIVKRSMEKAKVSQYWQPIATGYNKTTRFTRSEPVDTDLEAYVTQKAIQGLFVKIAEEEKNIRVNPLARTSDTLKKVFE